MMHRIVEAFTRPQWQVTAMDELVKAAVVLVIIGAVFLAFVIVGKYLDK